MGITIHYRGTMDDLERVEVMEDRVTDLVFALGGRVTIWRSFADQDSSRVVRGLIIQLSPGQDTFSLLVSPEGHLTPLFQIEDAEKSPFDEPPFCFVKTQFGSLGGHVAIVHVLESLQQHFISNLEITDEGEYAGRYDLNRLKSKKQFLDDAIHRMSDSLQEHGLSPEAAEDPSILATRIERIAMLVQQKLAGQSIEPNRDSLSFSGADFDSSLEDEVAIMDSIRRRNDLRNERMNRCITEAIASGMRVEDALQLAMKNEDIADTALDQTDDGQDDAHNESEQLAEPSDGDEPWRESLTETSFDDSVQQTDRERHPAVEQARAFLMNVGDIDVGETGQSTYHNIAYRGAGDMVGGLVQATHRDFDTRIARALAISQLKRALAGHAFARGAIFGLVSSNAIDKPTAHQLIQQLESLLDSIHNLMAEAWNEKRPGW